MEITKVVKPFIRRGWPNTFGNIVYIYIYIYIYIYLHFKSIVPKFFFLRVFWKNVWIKVYG